jgi:hypothetical protein
MTHNTLENYYRTIFSLAHHHHYQISDIENLMVFERDIYLDLLKQFIEKQELERNQRGY